MALDIDEARQRELEKVRQQPGESIVHFNRRFKTLMDEAYPADANGVRAADTHKILARIYGRGLLQRGMVNYMMSHGRPNAIEAAMTRCRAKEEAADAIRQLGREDEEPMEAGMVAPADNINPSTVPRTKAPSKEAPQPSLEMQRLQSHIAKLEAKIDRLSISQQQECHNSSDHATTQAQPEGCQTAANLRLIVASSATDVGKRIISPERAPEVGQIRYPSQPKLSRDRRPHINLTFSGILANCLIDTGASMSLINSKFYENFKKHSDRNLHWLDWKQ